MEYSCLVTNFRYGATIRLPSILIPANKSIRSNKGDWFTVIDTGADTSAFTKEYLMKNGYGKFTAGRDKQTAIGLIKIRSCKINGLLLANQFPFAEMDVDVLEGWNSNKVVGVIGMDILSQMTFVISHEFQKFLLTNEKLSEISKIINR